MASIATVVTRGYGSFGSVNLLPTHGYGIGAEAAANVTGIEYATNNERLHYENKNERAHFEVIEE